MREIKKIKEKVDELENVLKDRDLFKGKFFVNKC